MEQTELVNASRDVISGGIGGILSYHSLQASGIAATTGNIIAGFLMVVAVSLVYRGLSWSGGLGERIAEYRHSGGQPERERNKWPEGRAS